MVPFTAKYLTEWLSRQNLTISCNKIHERSAPLTNCWCFLDGTVRPICRPERNLLFLYNEHKKVHGIKFQSVATHNGLIANLFGPVVGCRHDKAMLAGSGLLFHSPRWICTVHLW